MPMWRETGVAQNDTLGPCPEAIKLIREVLEEQDRPLPQLPTERHLREAPLAAHRFLMMELLPAVSTTWQGAQVAVEAQAWPGGLATSGDGGCSSAGRETAYVGAVYVSRPNPEDAAATGDASAARLRLFCYLSCPYSTKATAEEAAVVGFIGALCSDSSTEATWYAAQREELGSNVPPLHTPTTAVPCGCAKGASFCGVKPEVLAESLITRVGEGTEFSQHVVLHTNAATHLQAAQLPSGGKRFASVAQVKAHMNQCLEEETKGIDAAGGSSQGRTPALARGACLGTVVVSTEKPEGHWLAFAFVYVRDEGPPGSRKIPRLATLFGEPTILTYDRKTHEYQEVTRTVPEAVGAEGAGSGEDTVHAVLCAVSGLSPTAADAEAAVMRLVQEGGSRVDPDGSEDEVLRKEEGPSEASDMQQGGQKKIAEATPQQLPLPETASSAPSNTTEGSRKEQQAVPSSGSNAEGTLAKADEPGKTKEGAPAPPAYRVCFDQLPLAEREALVDAAYHVPYRHGLDAVRQANAADVNSWTLLSIASALMGNEVCFMSQTLRLLTTDILMDAVSRGKFYTSLEERGIGASMQGSELTGGTHPFVHLVEPLYWRVDSAGTLDPVPGELQHNRKAAAAEVTNLSGRLVYTCTIFSKAGKVFARYSSNMAEDPEGLFAGRHGTSSVAAEGNHEAERGQPFFGKGDAPLPLVAVCFAALRKTARVLGRESVFLALWGIFSHLHAHFRAMSPVNVANEYLFASFFGGDKVREDSVTPTLHRSVEGGSVEDVASPFVHETRSVGAASWTESLSLVNCTDYAFERAGGEEGRAPCERTSTCSPAAAVAAAHVTTPLADDSDADHLTFEFAASPTETPPTPVPLTAVAAEAKSKTVKMAHLVAMRENFGFILSSILHDVYRDNVERDAQTKADSGEGSEARDEIPGQVTPSFQVVPGLTLPQMLTKLAVQATFSGFVRKSTRKVWFTTALDVMGVTTAALARRWEWWRHLELSKAGGKGDVASSEAAVSATPTSPPSHPQRDPSCENASSAPLLPQPTAPLATPIEAAAALTSSSQCPYLRLDRLLDRFSNLMRHAFPDLLWRLSVSTQPSKAAVESARAVGTLSEEQRYAAAREEWRRRTAGGAPLNENRSTGARAAASSLPAAPSAGAFTAAATTSPAGTNPIPVSSTEGYRFVAQLTLTEDWPEAKEITWRKSSYASPAEAQCRVLEKAFTLLKGMAEQRRSS